MKGGITEWERNRYRGRGKELRITTKNIEGVFEKKKKKVTSAWKAK